MQKIAIIDVGSNSARLVIYHLEKNGSYKLIYSQKEALRLSQKFTKTGDLSIKACKETVACLKNFALLSKIHKVNKIIAVATAAIRSAKNKLDLLTQVKNETGINLHVITGSTEAYITYLGVVNTLDYQNGLIFDLGGGSTELVLFRNKKIVESISIPIGAVNLTNMFKTKNTMDASVFTNISYFLQSKLKKHPWLKKTKLPLIGVGGTIRTMTRFNQKKKNYYTKNLHNYVYSLQEFSQDFDLLRSTNLVERKKIVGFNSNRADIILAGGSIIHNLLDFTGSKDIIISGCGIREGLFFDYYSKTFKTPIVAPNILKNSTENILKQSTLDERHSFLIRDFALKMFDAWEPIHKLPASCRKIIETASVLHDIGITINYYNHAAHSGYIIDNTPIYGLTHHEQTLAAIVASWHEGIKKAYLRSQSNRYTLSIKDLQKVHKMALLVALAESLDYSQRENVTNIFPMIEEGKKAVLLLSTIGPCDLELQNLLLHAKWFTKTFNYKLSVSEEQTLDFL